MQIKFLLNGEKREGTFLAEGHEKDAARRVLLVGMVRLNDGSFQRLVYLRPSQVIERIPEEGDEGYENKAVAEGRRRLVAHWMTEAHKEESDG